MEDGGGRYVWCWWYWLVGIIRADAWFAPLDEPLYERYSCLTVWLGQGPIFADVSITSLQTFSLLSVVGNVVLLCPPLSNVNGKYQQNQRLPVLNFNGGIIILLEVNIESFWCSCPALPWQTVVDLRGRWRWWWWGENGNFQYL